MPTFKSGDSAIPVKYRLLC